MKSDDEIKIDCNRYQNGECHSRHCLLRGGWKPGEPVDYSVAICDAHEIITLRAKLAIAVTALEALALTWQTDEPHHDPTLEGDIVKEALAKIRS